MKKKLIFILLLFSLNSFLTSYQKKINLKKANVLVKKVIDGDTLVVRFSNNTEKTIRFWGIDAPEASRTRNGIIEYLGKEVKNWLTKYIENRYCIIIYSLTTRNNINTDRYGRILAYVKFKNYDLFKTMLLKGYAKVYIKRKSPRYYEYIKYENYARKNKLGIWGKINH